MNVTYTDLLPALRAVLCAVDDDNYGSRKALDAVHWNVTPDALILTGTNGFVMIETKLTGTADKAYSALLPVTDMRRLAGLLKMVKPPVVEIVATKPHWTFSFLGISLMSEPLLAKTPDYAQAWSTQPQHAEGHTTVDLKLLNRALKYAPKVVAIESHGRYDFAKIYGENFRAMLIPTSKFRDAAPARAALGEGNE